MHARRTMRFNLLVRLACCKQGIVELFVSQQHAFMCCAEQNGNSLKRHHSEMAAAPPQQRPQANAQAAAPAQQSAKPRTNHNAHAQPHPSNAPFSHDRINLLVEWIGSDECGEQGQEQVLNFIRDANVQLPEDEDGEVSLDLEVLPRALLWQLDAFCQRQSGGRYAPDAKPLAAAQGPRLQQRIGDSDDDMSQ